MQDETILTSIREQDSNAMRRVTSNRRGYYAAKRTMDIVISLILLTLASPFMLLIALAIYIYSPGPVLFIQERVGAKQRSSGKSMKWELENFRCFKFRTMKLNADSAIHQAYIKALIANNQEQMNAVQNAATRPRGSVDQQQVVASQNALTQPRKLLNDERVIAPGKILRKLSLDELPQLWNVLRGDMSMIGPRPAIPYEVEMYKPWHLRRLEAQPGISGMQQVAARCTADFDEQVKLDIEYIENQSLWLDLKIAFQTPLAILSTRGAY
jgi:lipopolysaccharide/colanic/teichoic acid biosynthesis glycosyltransferase